MGRSKQQSVFVRHAERERLGCNHCNTAPVIEIEEQNFSCHENGLREGRKVPLPLPSQFNETWTVDMSAPSFHGYLSASAAFPSQVARGRVRARGEESLFVPPLMPVRHLCGLLYRELPQQTVFRASEQRESIWCLFDQYETCRIETVRQPWLLIELDRVGNFY